MKPDEKFPIEPLSDAAWNRVEHAVFERLRTPVSEPPFGRRRAAGRLVAELALGVGLLAVAAALVLLLRAPASGPAALASTRIAADSAFTDTMLDDVSIRLDPRSALVVVENGAESSLVVLERGVARFSVPARKRRPAFTVQAGDVKIEVVGTRFRVARNERGVRVDVDEGKVRVSSHGQSTLLRPGESFRAGPEPALTEPTLPPAPGAQSPEAQGSAPAARALDTPKPDQVLPARGAARVDSSLARGTARVDTAREPEPSRARRSDAQQQFERAARLEVSDPDAALHLYARLSDTGGRWGATALYARGRLLLELGKRTQGTQLLQRYLQEFPNGANVADVRSLVERMNHSEAARE